MSVAIDYSMGNPYSFMAFVDTTGTADDNYPSDAQAVFDSAWMFGLGKTVFVYNEDSTDTLVYKIVLQPNINSTLMTGLKNFVDVEVAPGVCDTINIPDIVHVIHVFIKNKSAGNDTDFAVQCVGRRS